MRYSKFDFYRLSYQNLRDEHIISSPILDYYFKEVWVPSHIKWSMDYSKKLLNRL